MGAQDMDILAIVCRIVAGDDSNTTLTALCLSVGLLDKDSRFQYRTTWQNLLKGLPTVSYLATAKKQSEVLAIGRMLAEKPEQSWDIRDRFTYTQLRHICRYHPIIQRGVLLLEATGQAGSRPSEMTASEVFLLASKLMDELHAPSLKRRSKNQD